MKQRALIYFSEFGMSLGGSEHRPLMFIAELQRRGYDITLALNWKSNIEYISKLSEIPIDVARLKVVLIKPKNKFLCKLDAILPFYRTWNLKKLAKDADVCISTVNMFDFGKPAHHFVFLMRHFGDNAFYDYFMHNEPKKGLQLFRQKVRTWLAEKILRPLLGMRSTRKILADPREHIYPNSQYVEETMRSFYGPFTSTVFYPPTTFDFPPSDVERDELSVVCVGRVIPEKRILDIIDIVERARSVSGRDLILRIAGQLDSTSYVEKLKQMSREKPWIQLVGPVYNQNKRDFLLSGTYAVHARRDEEFGIAVAEYLKSGNITIVPDEGGSREVVDNPNLTYHTNEEAARILCRLLDDPAFREVQRRRGMERAKYFSREAYLERQGKLMDGILSSLDGKHSNEN